MQQGAANDTALDEKSAERWQHKAVAVCRLRHPWVALLIVLLSSLMATTLVLVIIGYRGILNRGEKRDTHALFEEVVNHTQSVSDRIVQEFARLGIHDAPKNVLATLSSLEKISDYPIYTMRYYGPYTRESEFKEQYGLEAVAEQFTQMEWGCSLTAALGNREWPVMGRNFDWEYSPLLILFLEPEQGFQSVMSVDLAYLIPREQLDHLDEAPVEQLLPLLNAPFLTFDGMNEHGLAVGMAAVDYECGYPSDPEKRNVGDLWLMRALLEEAATAEEAVQLLEGINPVSQGGPNTHYLLADRTGSAALIEYHDGQIVVTRPEATRPWLHATNFPVVLAGDELTGICWRYDAIERKMQAENGLLCVHQTMNLLEQVSTPSTQWSMSYSLSERVVYLAVARNYEEIFRISLPTAYVGIQRDWGH